MHKGSRGNAWSTLERSIHYFRYLTVCCTLPLILTGYEYKIEKLSQSQKSPEAPLFSHFSPPSMHSIRRLPRLHTCSFPFSLPRYHTSQPSSPISRMSTRPTRNAPAPTPSASAVYCHTCGRIICKATFSFPTSDLEVGFKSKVQVRRCRPSMTMFPSMPAFCLL